MSTFRDRVFRRLYSGFLYLHILHHASEGPIYGVWMIDELRRHGYDIGPGSVYPLLHQMEREGLLEREDEVVGGKVRKYYEITERGRDVLAEGRQKTLELVGELMEGEADGEHRGSK